MKLIFIVMYMKKLCANTPFAWISYVELFLRSTLYTCAILRFSLRYEQHRKWQTLNWNKETITNWFHILLRQYQAQTKEVSPRVSFPSLHWTCWKKITIWTKARSNRCLEGKLSCLLLCKQRDSCLLPFMHITLALLKTVWKAHFTVCAHS